MSSNCITHPSTHAVSASPGQCAAVGPASVLEKRKRNNEYRTRNVEGKGRVRFLRHSILNSITPSLVNRAACLRSTQKKGVVRRLPPRGTGGKGLTLAGETCRAAGPAQAARQTPLSQPDHCKTCNRVSGRKDNQSSCIGNVPVANTDENQRILI